MLHWNSLAKLFDNHLIHWHKYAQYLFCHRIISVVICIVLKFKTSDRCICLKQWIWTRLIYHCKHAKNMMSAYQYNYRLLYRIFFFFLQLQWIRYLWLKSREKCSFKRIQSKLCQNQKCFWFQTNSIIEKLANEFDSLFKLFSCIFRLYQAWIIHNI